MSLFGRRSEWPYDEIKAEDLKRGASNRGDYGVLSPGETARLADKILASPRDQITPTPPAPTRDPDYADLKPGASNPELDAQMYGISQTEAARLAEEILAAPPEQILQDRADLTARHEEKRKRDPNAGRESGLPQGYADPRRL